MNIYSPPAEVLRTAGRSANSAVSAVKKVPRGIGLIIGLFLAIKVAFTYNKPSQVVDKRKDSSVVTKQFLANEKTAKKLIKLMKGKNIAQISITDGKNHISVKQKSEKPKLITPAIASQPKVKAGPDTIKAESAPSTQALKTIKSENIGTFHTSQKGKSLVKEGKVFEQGEKMAVITSMKIENEVEAAYKCKVIKLVAKENSIVEYGSTLFEVESL